MSITVLHENKEIQVSPDSLKLPEGYALITPDNVPSGYLKQEAVDRIVGDRVISAKQKAVNEFIEDSSKHETILSKYGVTVKDGKAFGVESANLDELKRDITLKVRAEVENEFKPARGENKLLRERVIMTELKNSVLKTGVKPDLADLAMKSFKDDFGIDKDGNVLVRDNNGFKVDGAGNYVTAESYFLDKKKSDSFKSLFDVSAQRGVGAGNSGQSGNSAITKADLKTVIDKVNYISANGQEAYNKLPNK